MALVGSSAFNFLAFAALLGIIIFVHEFGHLITAKAFGMRVFIFSFGFGKRLAGFKWGDTDCRLSLVPLGGYVKLEGEPEDHLSEDTSALGDGRDFTSRPRWQRFVVYLAGPLMNGILAIVVFSLLFMVGFQVDAIRYDRPVIGVVDPGSPAEAAGLRPGDEILQVDDRDQGNWEDVLLSILPRPDSLIKLRIGRGAEVLDLTVRSKTKPGERTAEVGLHPLVRIGELTPHDYPAEKAGLKVDDGILQVDNNPVAGFEDIAKSVAAAKVEGQAEARPIRLTILRSGKIFEVSLTPVADPRRGPSSGLLIGIGRKVLKQKYGPRDAIGQALQETWKQTREVFTMFERLLTGQASARASFAGPIGIASAAAHAAQTSAPEYVHLIALISLSVGILNLFPLAPLDGGHLAILAGEGLFRRDFSVNVKTWVMNAGAMVLFLLIGFIIYSDLSKTSLLGKYLP